MADEYVPLDLNTAEFMTNLNGGVYTEPVQWTYQGDPAYAYNPDDVAPTQAPAAGPEPIGDKPRFQDAPYAEEAPKVASSDDPLGDFIAKLSGNSPYADAPYAEDAPKVDGVTAEVPNGPAGGKGGTGSGSGNEDKNKADMLDKLLGNDKVMAALIAGGFGILGGASKGAAQEKAWSREDKIRAEAVALKAKNAQAGNVANMKWSPSNPQGTGLLGARVG